MTLVSSLIASAFRESNIIPLMASPTDNQNAEALSLLNPIMLSVFGNDAGYRLNDWVVSSAVAILDPSGLPADLPFVVDPQSRLVGALTAAATLELDPLPQDGQRLAVVGSFATYSLTLASNGRAIEGASTRVVTDAAAKLAWFYRADTGNWLPIADVALTDDFPLPEEFDSYFICRLAARLNPRYGRTLDPASTAEMQQTQGQLKARYNQTPLAPSGQQPGTGG